MKCHVDRHYLLLPHHPSGDEAYFVTYPLDWDVLASNKYIILRSTLESQWIPNSWEVPPCDMIIDGLGVAQQRAYKVSFPDEIDIRHGKVSKLRGDRFFHLTIPRCNGDDMLTQL